MTCKRNRRNLNGQRKQKKLLMILKLLVNPPVLKAPTPDGLFHLERDTSREGVGSTLITETRK